jgi:copper resistance protein D
MIGFLDVVLRGLVLLGQSIALGGVAFALVVARPLPETRDPIVPLRRVLAGIAAGAALVIVAQAVALVLDFGSLASDAGSTLADALATVYARTSLARIAVAALVIVASLRVRRRPGARGWTASLVLAVVALGIVAGLGSHAIARMEHRALLVPLDVVHQVTAAVWVGGLLHLIGAVFRSGDDRLVAIALRRFSTMAIAAVTALTVAGIGLTVGYVGTPRAFIGTGYGLMVLTKIVLLAGLLGLGALNFLAVRRVSAAGVAPAQRVRRLVEVELGVGITVLFAAASLTSLPPAIDVPARERATPVEVASRFQPQWPRMTSPAHSELPSGDREAPRTPADEAWSEYNHHYAGVFVLAMGLLSIGARLSRWRWARHWPLVFLGLAVFLFIRDDPGAWPLGPEGFWASMMDASVLQHRIFVLVIVAFGIFEWAVRTGRLTAPACALAFPLLCAVAGGLLLTHSHASLSLKYEYLIEITHAPLGVLGIVMAWARWLELRLPEADTRIPGWIWPPAFAAVGLLLLLYRES